LSVVGTFRGIEVETGDVRFAGQGRRAGSPRGLNYASAPHILIVTQWQPARREPAKTKAELREMLAEAVRNTQPEPKRAPKAKKDAATGA
jgi:hypothetical protein